MATVCQGFSVWLSHALCVEGPQLFIHQPSRDMSSYGHATGAFVSKLLLVCTSSLSWVCPQQWSVQQLPTCCPSGVLLVVHHSGLLLATSLGFPFVDLFSGAPHSTPGVAQADSGTRVHICLIGFIYINPVTLRLQRASSADTGIFLP